MAPLVRTNSLHPEGRTQPHCAVSGVQSAAGNCSYQCAGSTRLCNFRASSSSPSLQLFPFNLSFQSVGVHTPPGESLALLISRVTMSCEPCGFPGFCLICGLKADPSRRLKAWWSTCTRRACCSLPGSGGGPQQGPRASRAMLPHTGVRWEPGPEQVRRTRCSQVRDGAGNGG